MIVVAAKDLDTGETKLQLIRDPKIQVYILQEGYRNFTYPREYLNMSNCNMYLVSYKNLYTEIATLLEPKRRQPFNEDNAWMARKIVESSPYVVGWNIDPQVMVKCEYLDATPKDPTHLNLAVLDIETSVLPDTKNAVICLSICDWRTRQVHCFIDTAEWLRDFDAKELTRRTQVAYQEFVDGLNPKARKLWDQQPIAPIYYQCEGEADLLVRAFKKLHELKPDFLAVWNLGFDCPHLIQRAQFRELDLGNLFCHPDIPEPYRYVEWHADTTKVDHFTDVWHVLQAPGYTYWYDAMALYARIRKVQGRDIKYSLDYIGNKIIGSGKMHFGANQSHYLMQTNDPIGYCVYNTIDTLIPALMDAITQDLSTMLALSDRSLIQDFSRQTVRLTAQFYKYLIGQSKVPGACVGSQKQATDVFIGNIGGAVLNPVLMRDKGIVAVKESPRQTNIYKLASDLDVSSFYPSTTIAANVSKETKLFTTLWMEGCPYTLDDIQNAPDEAKQALMAKQNAEYINEFYGLLPCVLENAVSLCKAHFNLPDYAEMLNLINLELKESNHD